MDSNLLLAWGATLLRYKKGQEIFNEGSIPRYYFQVEQGEVKLINLNEDGKEFTQGVFISGQCFGEAPLIINEPYPSTAVAAGDCIIFQIPRDRFFSILDEYRQTEREILLSLSRRVYSKAITTRELIHNNPSNRILAFLDNYRKRFNLPAGSLIPLTRQEIANFTGLRVETVIRTLLSLSKQGRVKVINRKLYF